MTGQVSPLGTPPKLQAGSTPLYRQPDYPSNVVGAQQLQPLVAQFKAELQPILRSQEQLSQCASKQEVLNEVQQMLQQFQQQHINLWAQMSQVTQVQSQRAMIESLTTSLDSAQR
ncbi:uncharacterized protein ATNIH1004_002337 [Aspergillus tanneri]|uniref:Uncharacterized protein n=1 Tax=Aspergillus tanneri TaxID=1220188 RepID=A0A5M9MUP9_9EURO|nr:uncharacterized protein ATNIH1004_002337 [Aspergillus tanneri]KAA8649666.1 hypothetical protein ATNIH1004_002337 [Aspergillus tanneri]